MRTVLWQPAALRDLRKMRTDVAAAIIDKIEEFGATGDGDLKKLQGVRPPRWRLRVGNYRAILDVQPGRIVVERAFDRKDAEYR